MSHPDAFISPLNAFLRNIPLQEVRCFAGVDWNPQEVPSHLLQFMMLLFVISGLLFFFVVFVTFCFKCMSSVPDLSKLHLSHLHVLCALLILLLLPCNILLPLR